MNNIRHSCFFFIAAFAALAGGACLYAAQPERLGLTAYVNNMNCRGVAYSNRIDLAYALDFIRPFLP